MTSGLNLFLIELRSAFKIFSVKSKKKGSSAGTIAVFVFIVLTFAFTLVTMGLSYNAQGVPSLVLAQGFLIATYMVVILSITTITARLFASSDYELLASLPLTKTRIVTTKVLAIYAANLIVTFIFGSLAFWCFKFMTNLSPLASLKYGMLMNLVLLVLPMAPMAIMGLFGYLASLCRGKIPPLVQNIIYIVVFVVVFALCFGFSFANGSELALYKAIPSIYWAYRFLEGDILSGVFYFLGSFVLFALFILLSAHAYSRINERSAKVGKKKQASFVTKANASLSRDLYAREWKRLSTNITIFTETLMPIIFGVVFIFIMKSAFLGDDELPANIFITILILFAALCGGMQSPSGRLMSLEGKNFAILKSLPISGALIAKAKIGYGETLIAIEAIMYAIAIAIVAKIGILLTLAIGIFLFGLLTLDNVRSYLADARDPKLNWENPAEILKQSSRTLVNMVFAFIFALLTCGAVYVVLQFLSPILSAILIALLGIALVFISLAGFSRKTEASYAAIDA